jgi:hypothetical protein
MIAHTPRKVRQCLDEAEAVADVTAKSFNPLRLVERLTIAQKIHDAGCRCSSFGLIEAMPGSPRSHR